MSLIDWSEGDRIFVRRLDKIHLKLHEAVIMVKLAKQAHLQHLPTSTAQLVAKLREVVAELDDLAIANAALETQASSEPRPAAD